MYLPRMTLRALDTIGLTHLESIRTAMAAPLEGSTLVPHISLIAHSEKPCVVFSCGAMWRVPTDGWHRSPTHGRLWRLDARPCRAPTSEASNDIQVRPTPAAQRAP
eukprot:scaffold2123_cov111-Isochrysis_galbana.AAC.10